MHVSVAADAHVCATHAAAAGGERIIIRSGYFFYQDIRKYFFSPPDSFPELNSSCYLSKKLMRRRSSASRMCRVENHTRR